MRRITVRLGDYVEEEKRRDRRGGRVLAVAAIVVAGLMVMSRTPTPPPQPGTPAHLAASAVTLAFPPQLAGTMSGAQLLRLINDGGEPLSIVKIAATNDAFRLSHDCGGTLAPNDSCSAAVVFAPTLLGAQNGSVAVETNIGTTTISLAGEGRAVPTVDLGATDFGQAPVGSVAERSIRFMNSGATPIAVAKSAVDAPFQIVADGCSGTVAPGGNCEVRVQFHPAAGGSATGELQLAGPSGAAIAKGALLGAGVAEGPPQPPTPAHLVTPPAAITFPPQSPGTASGEQFVRLQNDGDEALTIGSVVVRGNAFRVSNDCGKPLARNEACNAAVVFAPPMAGKHGGMLMIGSNGGAAMISLGGEAPAIQPIGLPPTDFGRVLVGVPVQRVVRFTNSAAATIVVGKATALPPFEISSDGCRNRKVATADTCEVQVRARPAAGGKMKGELILVDPRGDVVARGELRGTAMTPEPPQLLKIDIEPHEINFHGDPGKKTINVANNGTVPVTLGVKPETTTRYGIDASQCDGVSLSRGQRCSIVVSSDRVALRLGSSTRIVISYAGRTEFVPVVANTPVIVR